MPWWLLSQLIRRRREGEVHQAASLEVKRAAVVERQRYERVQVVDESLPRFGRDVAIHEQRQIEIDQALGRGDPVRLDLSRHVGEIRLVSLTRHRQTVPEVESLEQRGGVDPARATPPAAYVRRGPQILSHCAPPPGGVRTRVPD